MDKKELVNKYGEYGVPYEAIRGTDLFKMNYMVDRADIIKVLDDIEKRGELSKELEFLYSDNVLLCLELGNLDIELILYGIEDNKLEGGFYVCARYGVIDWNSEGYAKLEVNKELFKSRDNLEKNMYKSLMQYAKENNLTWSEYNKYR